MLRIYEVSLEMLRDVRPLADEIALFDAAHARQLRNSSMSVTLNIAEGAGNRGGHRRARYDTALGSTRETLANLEASAAVGYITAIDPELRAKLNRIIGTLVNIIK